MTNEVDTMTIAQLQSALDERAGELKKLKSKREKLAERLEAVDAEIEAIEGAPVQRQTRKRAGRNSNGGKSLRYHIVDMMRKSRRKSGFTKAEIAENLLNAGYQTSSDNFENMVQQSLYKYDDLFASVSRGKFGLAEGAVEAMESHLAEAA